MSTDSQLTDGALLGLGNPLLDMELHVDKAYLDKWSLKENDAILATDEHVPLFNELNANKDTVYVPGGSTQNALRIAAWLLQRPHTCVYMGCIGDDVYGRILADKAKDAGVDTYFQVNAAQKTGTCAVLVYKQNRSLAAHLAAANCFTVDHLQLPEIQQHIASAKITYIEGYHLTVCPPAIQLLAEHSHAHNKTFSMNLSAPFICQFFKQPFHDVLPYVDILFGNESEALAWAESNDWKTTNPRDIAVRLAQWEKRNTSRPRMVVITQGAGDVLLVDGAEHTVHTYPVAKLSADEIVDTNGAGDGFVGGFLAQYARGATIPECVRCAIWTATVVLKHSGCTTPKNCDYK